MSSVVMIVINNYTNDARVDRAASTLAREGYSVTVLALKDEHTAAMESINGYRVERIKVSTKNLPKKSFFQLPKYLEFIYRAYRRAASLLPCIIHAHDLNALPPAYLAAKRTGAQLIYDSHELALERNVMQYRSRAEKLGWGYTEQYLIRRCNEVITVSPGIARELASRYKIRAPRVIMNCPAYREISSGDIIRKQLHLAPEDIIILYQGIIAPHRGLEQLIDACLYLGPQYKIAILGSDSGRRAYLEQKAKEQGLDSRVFFLDPVPVDRVLYYAASADLGTCLVNSRILSHRLTLPNKLFECMIAGTPVIASDAYRELIKKTGCGKVCDSSNPRAIAAAIEDIFAHPEEYRKMSALALAAAKSTFNWQAESRKLLEIYVTCKHL